MITLTLLIVIEQWASRDCYIEEPWKRLRGRAGEHRLEKHNKTQKIEESTRQFSFLHFAENTQYSAEQTINFEFPFLHSFHEDNFRQLVYALKECHLHWLLVCFPKMSYFHAHDSEATGRWLVDWRPCFIFPGPRFPRFGTILQCMWIEILFFCLRRLWMGRCFSGSLQNCRRLPNYFPKIVFHHKIELIHYCLLLQIRRLWCVNFVSQRLLCVSSYNVSSEVIT